MSEFSLKIANFYKNNTLAFSLLVNMPILFEPQMIAQFLSKGGIGSIWILWANAIGLAFGIVFIAPLWKKLPIETENEINKFRYSGFWSNCLTKFRSLFLGVLVIPLLGAQLLLSFTAIISPIISLNKINSILLCGITMLTILVSNNIKNRIRIDAFIGFLSLLILFLIGIYWSFNDAVSESPIFESNTSLFNIGESWMSIFFIFGFHWVATGIYDFPDMEGQKLLASANQRDSRQLFRMILFMIVAQYFVYSLGFRAFSLTGLQNQNGEQIISNYINQSSLFIRFALLIFVIIPFYGAISNFQLWSGTLISGLSMKNQKGLRLFGMLLFTFFSVIWSLANESIWEVVKYLFVISAGVGPVFLLRWYWHRITAKVQFVAMVSSLLYANLYIILENNLPDFASFILNGSNLLNLKPYFFQVFIVTVSVVVTWLIFALSNETGTKESFNRFNSYTKGLRELNSRSNWVAFLFLTILIISSRIFSWYLVIGEYKISALFFIVMASSVFLYARRLNQIKSQD